MTNDQFVDKFRQEFPDFEFLYKQYLEYRKTNHHITEAGDSSFVTYLVEFVFELVAVKNDGRGFDGDTYSNDTDSYHQANRYTFHYFVKNRDMLAFWLL